MSSTIAVVKEVSEEMNQAAGAVRKLQTESESVGAHNATGAMEEGCKRVEYSVQQAEKAGSSLACITEAVSSITNMSNQVATATEKQSSVTEEINRNVSNINNESERNAELSMKIQNTNNELSVYTDQLRSLIFQFKKK